MLNVKQESCEYQLLKSFGLTPRFSLIFLFFLFSSYPRFFLQSGMIGNIYRRKLEIISPIMPRNETFFEVNQQCIFGDDRRY